MRTKRRQVVKAKDPIQKWAQRINWEKRVKAVCKPCWEIKYCPYGSLVENFPLNEKPDEKSCRIYGHDCPVFYVAEPLTETRELRRVTRSIPRPTQFRVLRRENYICAGCGKVLRDEDAEFDHIIPWSHGGSSDEHNVRVLCKSCNGKRNRTGRRFQDEYLVESLTDHFSRSTNIDIVKIIISFADFSHKLFRMEGRYPTASDFCKFFGRRKVQRRDEVAAEVVTDIRQFFASRRPAELGQPIFDTLRFRWGLVDGRIHKLATIAKERHSDTSELISAEASLIARLGWHIQLTELNRNKWLRL